MTAWERLTEVFDRGDREGVDHLTPAERELYLIQEFILEQEMNGLSGYFYNRLPGLAATQVTVEAMRRHGLPQLASLLSEAMHLFGDYGDPYPPTTWGEILRKYDPSDRLEKIADRIRKLDDYGLADSGIE
jgi:Domain of unknown function (DUF4375)